MIVVTGPGRSGTTFIQHALCAHPRIWIHGQATFPFSESLTWLNRLTACAKSAVAENERLGYAVPHFAGSPPEQTRRHFADMLTRYWTGFGEQREQWGIKAPWLGFNETERNALLLLWPEARFICCIRHPATTYQSLVSTFHPKMEVRDFAKRWTAAARFASRHAVAICRVDQWDELPTEDRKARFAETLAALGEQPTPETDVFIEAWPRVHKVTENEERKAVACDMRRYGRLRRYMREFGYG